MHSNYANTLAEQTERAIAAKVASYKTWRAMGICHQDAVDSVLQNSTWGPKLRQEVRDRCTALNIA